MHERSSFSNRLIFFFSFIMVLVYAACGIVLLTLNVFPAIPANSKKMFGVLLVLYSLYRGLMTFSKYRRNRKQDSIHSIIPVVLIATLISGCNSAPQHDAYTDTPTSGEILIVADESYQPIIQVQIDTFMEIYKYSKIHVRYLPEAEVFNQLMNNDSVRIAIVSRNLTEEEKFHFEKQKIIPRPLKIAYDAVALVVNKSNADTAITFEQLRDIMNGKIVRWSQLNSGGSSDSIIIVFDKNGSANSRFLSETFLKGNPFPKNTFATNSNASVVDYVKSVKGALGVISVNWISDQDDSTANGFLQNVNVVALSLPDTGSAEREFVKPLQAYIALKKYPLLRDVYIISREGRNGLGTGFASFVAGDKGQRMIRLMGLLPATMPVRIIQVH
jgi:phosphate transport system substrate-binding protein